MEKEAGLTSTNRFKNNITREFMSSFVERKKNKVSVADPKYRYGQIKKLNKSYTHCDIIIVQQLH